MGSITFSEHTYLTYLVYHESSGTSRGHQYETSYMMWQEKYIDDVDNSNRQSFILTNECNLLIWTYANSCTNIIPCIWHKFTGERQYERGQQYIVLHTRKCRGYLWAFREILENFSNHNSKKESLPPTLFDTNPLHFMPQRSGPPQLYYGIKKWKLG